jgi:hypothetical protein
VQAGNPVFGEQYLAIKSESRKPDPTRLYLIGADPAEGGEKNDRSAVVVLDAASNAEVFSEEYNVPPDKFALILDKLARQYRGILGVERNNHGHTVLLKLREYETPGLYIHPDEKYGWLTTQKTKPLMIDDLEIALREGLVSLSDKKTLGQLKIYEYKKNGGTGAPSKYRDERVTAFAIAYQMRKSKYVFNIDKVREAEATYVCEPDIRGEFTVEQSILKVSPHPAGPVKIWKWPVKAGQYAVGVVPAVLDSESQNISIAVVLDRSNYNVMAILSSNKDFDEFARDLRYLALLYNTAMTGIDDSLHTETLKTVLNDYNYPQIYEGLYKAGVPKHQQRIMYIDFLRALLRNNNISIPDSDIIRELYSYTETAGQLDTAPSQANHKVLATAIASYMVKENFYIPEKRRKEEEDEDTDND